MAPAAGRRLLRVFARYGSLVQGAENDKVGFRSAAPDSQGATREHAGGM